MPISAPSRRAGCLLLAYSLAACGTTATGGAPAPTTTTTTTVSSAAPTLTAADGANYAACADGTCEVTIPGPVDIAVQSHTFSVTEVTADGITFAVAYGGYELGASPKASCGNAYVFRLGESAGGMTGGSCGDPAKPPAAVPGAFVVQLAAVSEGMAVLRMVAG
ncbi:hypothetical protein SAMN04488074_10424 [Lentzea albidocapillata subsp. violacea]|uniref:Lipoprotein n=1 Tax=Lentzea albidocapillata subsp. violacea TaxID=128104 RepID=A0A1G8YGH5_9PSEU|nr:hypothetical protein [Lentzea albidocapillata]SDK01170.1 hypothetical protein SAMN04488074_10424 [Lentzea albidocapillata subsp. violacea]